MVNYNYSKIRERYTYPGDDEIIDRISKCSGDNERENRDIINSIVLWKVNRQVNIGNLFVKIQKLEIKTLKYFNNKEQEIKDVVGELLEVNGVRIAMASTILKMFYPDVFPIIDQRAYRELYDKEMPTWTSKQKWQEEYVNYVRDCHKYFNDYCEGQITFTDLDKVLYQIDKEKDNENLKGY